jgi:hypothetical protein
MSLCYIGVVVIRQIRCQVNPSTHIQVEAFARAVSSIQRHWGHGFVNEFQRFAPPLTDPIDVREEEFALAKRMRKAYDSQLDKLMLLLDEAGFEEEHVAEARKSANKIWYIQGAR